MFSYCLTIWTSDSDYLSRQSQNCMLHAAYHTDWQTDMLHAIYQTLTYCWFQILCVIPQQEDVMSVRRLLSWRMFKSVRRRISSQRNWWSWSTPCKPFTLTVPASVCHNQERGCMSLQWIRSSAKLFTVQISGRLGWRPAHYHGYDMIWYDMIDDEMI